MPADASPLAPLIAGGIIAFRDWMSRQPPWVHVVAGIAAMMLGGICHKCAAPAPTPVNVQLSATVPAPVIEAGPVNVQAAPVERVTMRQAIVADSMRARAARQLQRDGFALVGGDATPLSAEAAERLTAKVSDLRIVEGGKEVGAFEQIGDGNGRPFLDFIRSIFAWIRDHPETVEKWLKFILALLMLL